MYFESYANGRINSIGHTSNWRLWKEQDKNKDIIGKMMKDCTDGVTIV